MLKVLTTSGERVTRAAFWLLVPLCMAITSTAWAEKTEKTAKHGTSLSQTSVTSRFVSGKAVAFGITPAVRNLPAQFGRTERSDREEEENENERVKFPVPGAGAGKGSGVFIDPLLSQGQNSRARFAPTMPTPSLTFAGMTAAEACACLPPDTNGDVGPNNYVQAVNVKVSIYDKAGTRLLGPVLQSSAFFSGLPAGNACRTTDDGDPIVVYDSLADRWIISQFSWQDVPGHQCIAVSQTSDPTGAYYAYDFVNPNSDFQDYPHFGVWTDGYYMSTNQFNQAGTAFLGGGIFAFERVKMLSGDPTASYVYHDVFGDDPSAGGMLPTDLDGNIAPPYGLPNRFMEFRADEYGDPLDALRTYELVPNYATPASSTFTIRSDIPLSAFDARAPSTRNAIEQISGNKLDAISDRLMFRLAYRNLGSRATPINSWVGNFSVNVSGVNPTTAATYQTGVRWFELRSTDTTSLATLRDEGTENLAPGNGATGINNWMGSIAQDNQGNIGVGFSAASTTQNANITIAGRTGSSTGVGLNEGEAVFFAAGGAQSSSSGRWGDYSSLTVDPVDECTFWYTQEYYSANSSSSWNTRIGKFVFPACTAPPVGSITGTITNCTSGLPVANILVQFSGGYSRSTLADGTYSVAVTPGTYSASATAPGYSTVSGSGLVVADAGTATFSGCVTGIPIIDAGGSATVVSENAVPANSTADPGETLTVSLPVLNSGTADTVSLVGTLQATADVTGVSAAQTYGVVTAGGAAASQNFTFTVASTLTCGSVITLTLALQDGESDLGTVSYTMRLGTLLVGSPQTFSNTATITINDDAVASPYPSTITVSGVTDPIGTLTVGLKQFSHSYPSDVSVLLVSPTGQKMAVLSGAGDGVGIISATFTLDDAAAALIPDGESTFTGDFLPSNYANVAFPAPAPEGPYLLPAISGTDTLTSAFSEHDANGVWSLYVEDLAAEDDGNFNGGWDLTITPAASVCAVPPQPSLSIGDVSITEGNSGTKLATFTVSLSAATPSAVTYNIFTSNNTAAGPSDFTVKTLIGESIAAGLTSKTFTVSIKGDTTIEADETFFVKVNGVTGATVLDGQATGTIVNDDTTPPSLSIGDVSVTEGNSGTKLATFTVSLSKTSASAVTYNIYTGNDTAAGPSDFAVKTLTGESIAAGLTSKIFTVTVNGDTTVEPNETFKVNVSAVVGATVADGQGVGTILNDDVALPSISIGDVSITEGNSGTKLATFTVSLSKTSTSAVTYNIYTGNDTAAGPSDFAVKTLTGESIAVGLTSKTFTVTINGDTQVEPNETFKVNLGAVVGATVADGQAIGTITNDDGLSIAAVQSNGPISPYVGKQVELHGIVTALRRDGFFMQTPDAERDNDPTTSEGIFVFTKTTPTADAAVGNRVQVTGQVQEAMTGNDTHQFTLTQLAASQVKLLARGVALPTSAVLKPGEVNARQSIDRLERYEGMRVSIPALSVVAPVGGSVDEVTGAVKADGIFYGVSVGTARPFREPGIGALDVAPIRAGVKPPVFDTNPERLMIDSLGQVGAVAMAADTGDTIRGLSGVLSYGSGTYQVLPNPHLKLQITAGANPRPVSAKASSEYTIGSFSLRRFFDDASNPASRAGPVLNADTYALRLAKTANAVCAYARSPDILGVTDVENLTALFDLAAAVNSNAGNVLFPHSCAGDVGYRAYLTDGNDASGSNVGFLVSTAQVRPGVPRVQVLSVQQQGKDARFSHPDGSSEPLNGRPPLVLRARLNQADGSSLEVTVIANHLHSLDGISDDSKGMHGWASNAAYVRAKRSAQALYLAGLIQARQVANPSERLVVLGDFNAYEFSDGYEDVMGVVTGREAAADQVLHHAGSPVKPPLTNLTSLTAQADRYTVTHQGNAQALDHILVNQFLLNDRHYSLRTEYARLNADSGADNADDVAVPVGVSDHDPIVLYLTTK